MGAIQLQAPEQDGGQGEDLDRSCPPGRSTVGTMIIAFLEAFALDAAGQGLACRLFCCRFWRNWSLDRWCFDPSLDLVTFCRRMRRSSLTRGGRVAKLGLCACCMCVAAVLPE
jgi:hypothetical protein